MYLPSEYPHALLSCKPIFVGQYQYRISSQPQTAAPCLPLQLELSHSLAAEKLSCVNTMKVSDLKVLLRAKFKMFKATLSLPVVN